MMYPEIREFLQENEALVNWKEVNELVVSIINDKPKHIQLPGLVAQAFGRDQSRAVAVCASLTLAFCAIVVLDDLLDGDRRYAVDENESASLANMSAGLISLAFQCLSKISDDPELISNSQATLSKLIFDVSYGQSLDVKNPNNEEDY